MMTRSIFTLCFVVLSATVARAQGTPAQLLKDIQVLIAAAAAQDPAHDAADLGNPVGIGCKALSLGANPTSVGANDRSKIYCTRDGQMFVLPGHPNTITENATIVDSDGAQTGTAIVSVSAGSRIVVTGFAVTCSNANTVNVSFKLAFDTDATFAAASTAGVVGHIGAHQGIAPGSGYTRTGLWIGADDEDVRYSLADPVTGGCDVAINYFTITG